MSSRFDEMDDLPVVSNDKQQSFFFFATLALASAISIIGVAGGFVYGDYYGRKHAQFENPELRKYYAGECYSYIDSELKKTIKASVEKSSTKRDEVERLDDIRGLIISLQMDVNELALNASKKPLKDSAKKKVASIAP